MMFASARTTLYFWAREMMYGTPVGAIARRLRSRVQRSAAEHERPDYWNRQIDRLYRRPNLNGRASSALRHTTTAVLLKTCGFSPRTALDLGCAFGHFAETLADIGVQRYVGVDLSDEGVAAARLKAPNRPTADRCRTEFHCADLRMFTPDEGDRFDLIVFSEVLKYVDVNEALRQVHRYERWLAPNGVFAAVLTDDPKCHAIFRKLDARFDWVYGTIYQQQPDGPRFTVTPNRANPAYLVGLFQPRESNGG
jgi:SAM-dependent methyltransferase